MAMRKAEDARSEMLKASREEEIDLNFLIKFQIPSFFKSQIFQDQI